MFKSAWWSHDMQASSSQVPRSVGQYPLSIRCRMSENCSISLLGSGLKSLGQSGPTWIPCFTCHVCLAWSINTGGLKHNLYSESGVENRLHVYIKLGERMVDSCPAGHCICFRSYMELHVVDTAKISWKNFALLLTSMNFPC